MSSRSLLGLCVLSNVTRYVLVVEKEYLYYILYWQISKCVSWFLWMTLTERKRCVCVLRLCNHLDGIVVVWDDECVYLNYNKNRILTPFLKKTLLLWHIAKGERGVQIPPIIWVFMQVGARVLPGLIPKPIKYNLGNGRARPRVLWTWSRMAICSNWWCWRVVVVWSECRL